jgi:hypothetical protein
MFDLVVGILIGMGISAAAFALMLYLYPRLLKRG